MVNATRSPKLFAVPTVDEHEDLDQLPPAPDGAPPGPWTKDAAYRFCERMATSHYENFPVASRFVPAPLRPHVWAIYAFSRTADDFSDEPRFEGRRREALDAWEHYLEVAYHRDVDHPIFLALRDSVRRHNIPIGPFKALLTAFRMDLTKHRYASFSELRNYCTHSANPVGQLVLYVHGHRQPELHRFSDEICSGLQIANFLQDLSVDIPRGRCYIPQEDLIHFGVTWDQLQAGRHSVEFKELMRFEIARVRTMFLRGQPLIRKVSPGLSLELEATWRGGMKVLDLIEARDYEVLDYRPTLDKRDVVDVAGRSLVAFGQRFFRGEV
ncbi:squalene synthase HpnC [Pseudenhygromyxa sp. WMMC2535]|uniref:squalene synthase HpnC n=1 Tax=Pseudenhygromyxa sp. WMMC2535 TaxID=2712867 RepID=UPI0015580213|nr:squalene synthase HpnC [Pseudenhygromyxa sp. WMMC2535]NVB41712.1 squalene synthase HpnC [Pseudenhygromyxa sp. WMMC2535]